MIFKQESNLLRSFLEDIENFDFNPMVLPKLKSQKRRNIENLIKSFPNKEEYLSYKIILHTILEGYYNWDYIKVNQTLLTQKIDCKNLIYLLQARVMDAIIRTAPLMPIESTLFRGLSVNKYEDNFSSLVKGDIIKFPGFTSTSTSRFVAFRFANKGRTGRKYMFVISVPSLYPLFSVEFGKKEHEVIFPICTKFVLKDEPLKLSDDFTIIHLTASRDNETLFTDEIFDFNSNLQLYIDLQNGKVVSPEICQKFQSALQETSCSTFVQNPIKKGVSRKVKNQIKGKGLYHERYSSGDSEYGFDADSMSVIETEKKGPKRMHKKGFKLIPFLTSFSTAFPSMSSLTSFELSII